MIELIERLQEETKKLEGLADASLAEQLIQLRKIRFITDAIEEAAILEDL